MHGIPVNKEEVLRELGHPKTWARHERELEFEIWLRPGETELSMIGINGRPGLPGYLGYLQKSFESPLGYGTSLVSAVENEEILQIVRAEVTEELKKYEALLKQYEQCPQKIAEYIEDLKRWVTFATAMGNKEHVPACIDLMEHYTQQLATLQTT